MFCRERADRPFRCLDSQYRRELVRVYLSNVEQICKRFVEEKRGKLGKLIEDKAKWSRYVVFMAAVFIVTWIFFHPFDNYNAT